MSCPHCLTMPLIPKYSMSELSHFIVKDNYIHLKMKDTVKLKVRKI